MRHLVGLAVVLAGCSSSGGGSPPDANAGADATSDVVVASDAVPTPDVARDAPDAADVTPLDSSSLDVGATDGGTSDVGAPEADPADTRFSTYPPWPDADVSAWLTGPDAAPACDAAPDAAPGTTFCELYRDFFSHPGAASCQTYGCHGGDVGVNGLALGWTARSMYDAMSAFKTWLPPGRLIAPVAGGDARAGSALADAVGVKTGHFMPYLSSDLGNRKLTDAEVARISAWLARGAPFD